MMDEPTPKIGRKKLTTGIISTLKNGARRKEDIPPRRDFIAFFPSLYLIDTDTVIPTHNGPESGGNGAMMERIRFLRQISGEKKDKQIP